MSHPGFFKKEKGYFLEILKGLETFRNFSVRLGKSFSVFSTYFLCTNFFHDRKTPSLKHRWWHLLSGPSLTLHYFIACPFRTSSEKIAFTCTSSWAMIWILFSRSKSSPSVNFEYAQGHNNGFLKHFLHTESFLRYLPHLSKISLQFHTSF